MRVYLMGFMGAGKTTLGKELARNIGFKFVDLDADIEKAEKSTIAGLFAQKGEEYFRRKEKQYLKKITEQYQDAIIALGGGTPCFNNNLDYINENGVSVYIEVPEEILVQRLLPEREKRPLLKNLSDAELGNYIAELLSKRLAYYQKADIIHTFGNSPTDLLIELTKF